MTISASSPITLRLYVAGGGPRSRRAVEAVSEWRRRNRDELPALALEVIDVHEDVSQALDDGVVGVPALVRVGPGPVRQWAGDEWNDHRLSALVLDLVAQ